MQPTACRSLGHVQALHDLRHVQARHFHPWQSSQSVMCKQSKRLQARTDLEIDKRISEKT